MKVAPEGRSGVGAGLTGVVKVAVGVEEERSLHVEDTQ